MGPYYDRISLLIWRQRHQLRAGIRRKRREIRGHQLRQSSFRRNPRELKWARPSVLELVRKLLDFRLESERPGSGKSKAKLMLERSVVTDELVHRLT